MARANRVYWSPENIALLKEIFHNTPDRLIAEKLNMDVGWIKGKAQRLGLKKDPDYNRMEHSVAALTEEDKTFIREYYHQLTIEQLAIVSGRGESSILKVIKKLGLKKPNAGCYRKGMRPANFRKKSPGLAIGRMAETQFKKGGLPGNTLHDGAITLRLDHAKSRKGRPYKWIRVAKGKWELLHRHVWAQQNGPVPAKHVVTFKDGDTMNCSIDNLELITMADNARRNRNPETSHRAAKDLTDNYIAGRIAGRGNKALKRALIIGAPEIIEAKRSLIKLNRIIKNERHNKT